MSELTSETTCDPKAPLSQGASRGPARRLLAFYEIGRSLLEQEDPRQVIETIHQALIEHLEPDHACILRVRDDGSFEPLAVHNLDLDPPETEWPISRTALQRVRDSGLAILATDVLEDPQLKTSKSAREYRIRTVLAVPLRGESSQGYIYLDRRSKKRPFSEEDLRFLTAASAYAALVLKRATEYERTSEALKLSDERLELLQGELLRYQIVGRSKPLLVAYDQLRRLARAGARVLIRGETGTGKELFARAYAANSERSGRPYVPVPIPALAPSLIESELFGHVRGAFTAATSDRKGRLELAEGGVLFLDEVGDIELSLQAKLLRFLDSGELYRVGDNRARRVDALIVSATNRPLEKMIDDERFRGDLLARLGHVITIPPLRERPEDVPLLVEHFLQVYGRGVRSKRFAPETMEVLKRYKWEFNVRQLQQVVEHSVCLVDHNVVRVEDLPTFVHETNASASTREPVATKTSPPTAVPRALKEVVDEAEKEHIIRTLELTHGNRRKAIEILKISSETFYKRLAEFGLHKKKHERPQAAAPRHQLSREKPAIDLIHSQKKSKPKNNSRNPTTR